MTETVVRAAGAVPWRRADDGVEVLVVHRPRYDDWSFPKGKLDPGEDWATAAVREVLEETGLVVVLGEVLPGVSYIDHRGRPKQVRWWAATVAADTGFEPDDEVDRLDWVRLDEVVERLSYPRDVVVAEALADRLSVRPGA